jgi:hypothetical protein
MRQFHRRRRTARWALWFNMLRRHPLFTCTLP